MNRSNDSASASEEVDLWLWRHPRTRGAAGRCIGRTDLVLNRRKSKRLAHRIRAVARRDALPHVVHVSPLQRSRDVGAWLRRWGWHVQVDGRLQEIDFGRWDGLPWSRIDRAEVLAWQDDLLHYSPGGGESLHALAERARAWVEDVGRAGEPLLAVTHGGVINALLHELGRAAGVAGASWPAPPVHGSLTRKNWSIEDDPTRHAR